VLHLLGLDGINPAKPVKALLSTTFFISQATPSQPLLPLHQSRSPRSDRALAEVGALANLSVLTEVAGEKIVYLRDTNTARAVPA
jgi:hypothetical protein